MAKMKLLYFCMCIIIPMSFSSQNSNNLPMGPYKSTLTRSEPCKTPFKPYDKDPPYYFSSEIYTSEGKVLLRGNLTVARVNPNLKIRVRGFMLEDDKWNLIYMVDTGGCHGVIMSLWKAAFQIQSTKPCIPKGSYIYKDLDFNAIQQAWAKSYVYGKFLWRLQIHTNMGTSICWEYESVVEPK